MDNGERCPERDLCETPHFGSEQAEGLPEL
jgi:hypothetical protein